MPPKLLQCYYETLGVKQDVGDDELKKSYRRLALKLHPDKNRDNIEQATEQFRIVQQAYEVLSDPQERAWYDKHRDAILKGGCGFGENYQDESVDLMSYFTAACYTGFNDSENGFYTVYRQVFESLSKEEYEFIDDETEHDLPQFGTSKSPEEEFMAFYNYWQSFCTCKSYAWKDEYDTREAPDRRIRRLMEADNKKLRDAAKKERNEEVRELIAFMKKRDPRVKAYRKRLEEKAEEVKRKTEERRKKDLAARREKLDAYKESEWSSTSVIEKDLQQLEQNLAEQFDDDVYESEESDEELDDLFCIACGKSFKTPKARLNHEKSKKHLENVAALKLEMEEDDLKHFEDENEEEETEKIAESTLSDVDEDDESRDQLGKLSKLSKREKKLLKKQQPRATFEEESVDNGEGDKKIEEDESTDDVVQKKKTKNRRRAPKQETDDIDTEQAETNDVEEAISRVALSDDETDDSQPKSRNKKNKTKKTEPTSGETANPMCVVCNSKFNSRSKLFDHLKKTGHAVSPDQVTQANETGGKKSKKKSKR